MTWVPPAAFDGFRLTGLLGAGGMGRVYAGEDLLLRRKVAIKFIDDAEPETTKRRRFIREGQALARLNHPNVVVTYRVGEVERRPFLVSELLEGDSLDRHPLPLPWIQVLEIGIGICGGLAAVHRAGILHRDLKPANVVVTRDGTVKLIDFGVAKLVDEDAATELLDGAPPAADDRSDVTEGDPASPGSMSQRSEEPGDAVDGSARALSHGDAVLGTPGYLAPERRLGNPATRLSDLYSFGCLLHELCHGALPGARPAATPACVDPRFAAILARCLRATPRERFASAEDLLAALIALRDQLGQTPPGGAAQLLLERDAPLADLACWWSEACDGAGRLVLISGEAGIGKSAVMREFARRVSGRTLIGACDPLSTPRPLGPLVDIAPQIGGAVAAQLATGERVDLIFAALIAELAAASGPTLLVIEDAHWADVASLDLLRFLGRRLGRLPAMLVVTYRQDEVGPGHPLAITLGDLASSDAIRRLPLAPLSVDAVRRLAAGSAIDPDVLHHRSGGNPFFVTEALADAGAHVPGTVREAVMARVARLASDERAALEATAVLGARVRTAWVDAIVGRTDALASSVARGLIVASGELVAFRHELARDALVSAMTAEQRRTWHARALAVLAADPRVRRDEIATLAHHAEAAADPVAAREYGVAAAREAARLQAHRQAAEQFDRAQRYFPPEDSRELAEILEGHGHERYLTGDTARAIELRVQATEMWQRLGDRVRRGDNLRWLSRVTWFTGRSGDARRYARRAIETLETAPRGRELAAAYSNQAQLHMLAGATAPAVMWGQKAIALARRLGDVETECHARNNVGTARYMAGDPSGLRDLERSLALARDAKLDEHVARALTNLSSLLMRAHDLPRANRVLAEGLAYTGARDLDVWYVYLRGYQALAMLHGGRIAEAVEAAQELLANPAVSAISRIQPLTILGRARARRGEPDVWPALDEALALARETAELQRIASVHAARAEAAWLAGDLERARREVAEALPRARRKREPWLAGELLFVIALTGERRQPPPWLARPYQLYLGGRFARAATAWGALGCSYERAWSLAGDSPAGLRTAVETFEQLGMPAVAARAADRMRAVAERPIRGARRSTSRSGSCRSSDPSRPTRGT